MGQLTMATSASLQIVDSLGHEMWCWRGEFGGKHVTEIHANPSRSFGDVQPGYIEVQCDDTATRTTSNSRSSPTSNGSTITAGKANSITSHPPSSQATTIAQLQRGAAAPTPTPS